MAAKDEHGLTQRKVIVFSARENPKLTQELDNIAEKINRIKLG